MAETECDHLQDGTKSASVADAATPRSLGSLLQLTAALTAAATVEQVARAAVAWAVDALDAEVGALAALDDGGTPTLIAWHGELGGVPEPLLLAARAGTAVWRVPPANAPGGARGDGGVWAALPLLREGSVLGVFGLCRPAARPFAARERALLLAVAQQCAQSLELLRLQRAERQARTRTTRLQAITGLLVEALTPDQVANVVTTEGAAALEAASCSLTRLVGDGTAVELAGMVGYDASLRDRYRHYPLAQVTPMTVAITTCAPLWQEDFAEAVAHFPSLHAVAQASGDRAWATVPLLIEGRAIGGLGFSFRTPRRFSGEERAFILALAQQAAVALERARLFAIEHQLRQQGDFLAEAGATLADSLDYAATLERVVRLIVPALADWSTLDLVLPEECLVRVAAAHADRDREVALHVDSEDAIARLAPAHAVLRVAQTGQTLLSPALTADELPLTLPEPEYRAVLASGGTVSALVVPLRVGAAIIGVLTLARGGPAPPYGPDELRLVEEVARRAALAIDHARLYQEARAALAARDQFLAIAAHELRTPVTSMRTYAQLLGQQLAAGVVDPTLLRMAVAAIERGTGRLTPLIEDLLNVARLQAGRFPLRRGPVELVALLTEAVTQERLRVPSALRLDLTLGLSRYDLDGDAGRLEQVLHNVLENAWTYSPDGGTITVALAAEGVGVLITVRDEGIGLEAGEAEAIFTPFQRSRGAQERQIQGLGLGLALSRAIIEQHGGRLWAESPGQRQGTVVSLWLPQTVPDTSIPPAVEDPGTQPPAGRT